MTTIDVILAKARMFKDRIATLKSQTPYYPSILKREFVDSGVKEIFLTTNVRVKRIVKFTNKYYSVYVVKSGIITNEFTIDKLYEQLIKEVYSVLILYKVQPDEKPDINQISEKERLKENESRSIDNNKSRNEL